MKNLLYIVVVLVLVSCGKIQPEGNEIKTQEVKIEEFSALHLEGNFKVSYIQSTENKLTVETYPNIFENLKIKIKDKELTISEKRKTEGVEVYNIILYSSGKISKMKMQNSAEFNISSQMMMDDFSLKMEDNTKFAGAILSNKAEINLYDNVPFAEIPDNVPSISTMNSKLDFNIVLGTGLLSRIRCRSSLACSTGKC